MFIEFLTPEVFDAIVILNIVLGLAVAAWRFKRDLARPLPADAPDWARARHEGSPPPSATGRSQ